MKALIIAVVTAALWITLGGAQATAAPTSTAPAAVSSVAAPSAALVCNRDSSSGRVYTKHKANSVGKRLRPGMCIPRVTYVCVDYRTAARVGNVWIHGNRRCAYVGSQWFGYRNVWSRWNWRLA